MSRDWGNIEQVIYFAIDRTHKSMRRYSQRAITAAGFDITIDQWVLLKILEEKEELTQREMAEMVFKDNASVTRIVDQLIKKELATRSIHKEDRRTHQLELTQKGKNYCKQVMPIITEIRNKGIEGVTDRDLEITLKTLERMKDQFT